MMLAFLTPKMGKRLIFPIVALFLLVGTFFWLSPQVAHAASITGSINWSSPTGKTANLQYGLNAYNGYDPAVQGNTTYRTNVAAMKAGIVRWHYAGQMGDSSADRSGWIIDPTTSSYRWDVSKINRALNNALGSGGGFNYGPIKMMNIVNWPSYLDDGSGHLRPDAYDDYANLCAELVRIINIEQNRGFQYFEVFNELENGAGSPYDQNMDEVGRIFNQVVPAMKQVDPTIKVGGPAFARGDLTYNIDDFFSVAAPHLDFTSYHTYANGDQSASNQAVWDSANVGGITSSMRTEFAKYSSRSIEYFHDEYNISWNPPDSKMNTVVGGIFDALVMISVVNSGTNGAMAWNEGDGWYGKLDHEYNRRPASYLYQYLNEEMKGNVVSSSSANTAKVVTLAVKNGNKYAFMLVNRSETNQTIQLTLSGLPSSANTFTTKRMTSSGGEVGSVTVGTLTSSAGYTLPSNTVTILSLVDGGNNGGTVLTGTTIHDGNGTWSGCSTCTAAKVFDNNTATYYDAALATGAWSGIDLGSGLSGTVSSLKYYPRSGFTGRMVGGKFQGSNNLSTWNDLHTINTEPSENTWTTVTVNAGTGYRYLRYLSAGNESYGNVSEVQFIGTTSGGNGGSGLLGEYFNNTTLSNAPILTRTDTQVSFDWASGSPDSSVNNDNFSVRWTGQVQATGNGNYSFATESDDGVRLWVNGQLMIDNWTDHAPTINTSAAVTLTGGQKYSVKMEFYERGGGAVARLLWTPPGSSQQAVPQNALFPG